MKFKPVLPIIFLSLFMSAACSRSEPLDSNSNSNVNAVITDRNDDPEKKSNESYEELGLYIQVPYEPEETYWRRGESGLTAVLRFTPEDTKKLVAESETGQTDVPANVKVEDWFPKELIALAELNDGEMVTGKIYSSRKFDKDTNVNGVLVKIDQTELFILIYKASN